MNPYRLAPPPQWWPPALKPALVRLLRPFRRRQRVREHKMMHVKVRGAKHVQEALAEKCGVLITPNHSGHADAYIVYEAADQVGSPFHFMATWHLFDSRNFLGRWMLQWHGVFSVDREGTDLRAFKQAVKTLQNSPHPLVIFPEGEVYHCNDRVTLFREGAAAIALLAARRARRPVVCVPCAVKYEYLEDPTDDLVQSMAELERSIHWRPRPDLPLEKRIYRFAEAAMALKEMEFYGHAKTGSLPERTDALAGEILRRVESGHGISPGDSTIPERVKELRRIAIERLEEIEEGDPQRKKIDDELDDLFLVVQLFSYPGDYVAERPSIERLAETIDKFEEDALGKFGAKARSARQATVYFGEPIPIESTRRREAGPELTDLLEQRVQEMLDGHTAGKDTMDQRTDGTMDQRADGTMDQRADGTMDGR